MHNKQQSQNKIIESILQEYCNNDVPIVIGVSGGPDSIYLLHQLKTFWHKKNYNPNNIRIISCNHNTRSGIDQEIELVKSYSENHHQVIPVYTGGNTSEESLRKRRHQEFINICHKVGSTTLFLGHHLDDRIETSLLNMERGCGIGGIQAFSVREQHFLDPTISIIRPLIQYTKQDILTECEHCKLSYCVDPTNNDPMISKRNALRTQLYKYLNNNIIKSINHLYNFLDNNTSAHSDNHKDKYQTLLLENGNQLVGICAGERTASDIYMIYKLYNITINPRSTTLENLAQQLLISGKSIEYQGLHITAYKYGTVIKKK